MQTILVVEEDTMIRGLIRTIVETAGYQVVEAGDGAAGFQLARRGAVDAIILDCMGFHTNGMAMLRRIRGEADTAHLPVIALCGLGQSGAEVGLWANGLVVKPFRPAQLLMKVQMVMGTRAEHVASNATIQPCASA